MTYKNLSELKEKSTSIASSADIVNLKLIIGKMTLATLYKFLYTNAEFRLNLLADKIHTLYPYVPVEHVKTIMPIWEIATMLAGNPPQMFTNPLSPLFSTPSEEYKLYLSVIFEIFFLPFYFVKATD